jgi:hypothetical protein
MERVDANEASGSNCEVEPVKVLAEVSSLTGQLQTAGRSWKFKEHWCKEITWITFNHTTSIASCVRYVSRLPVLKIRILR